MYDIKQFKPALYLVLFLGLSGFAMASESLGLWLLCVLGIGVNGWLVFTGRFVPLPRWLANLSTIGALAYVLYQIATQGGTPLMYIGQFLVLLQLIKLFEQRANRDYAQLLVLSLLLMVAASINTASLLFAMLLAVYLVLSLYCCLLFHLKVEADRARAVFQIPADQAHSATISQDKRYLPRSMRRLTAIVATVAVTFAVFVFLFFPRGPGQGVLGQLQFRPSTSLTGFNDRVQFDQITRIKQNEEVVAHVAVFKDEKPVQGTETLFLRGLTLDTYRRDFMRDDRSQWMRTPMRRNDPERASADDSDFRRIPPDATVWRQKVVLRPNGSRFLFALPGVVKITPNRAVNLRYSAHDESVQTDPVMGMLEYEAISTNVLGRNDTITSLVNQVLMPSPMSDPEVIRQVRQYTRNPDIIGQVGMDRSLLRPIDPSNEEIAGRIERHLQTQFTYTLDLTDSSDLMREGDPVVNFLTKVKSGHCEYFASAMTLMCQSIGIPARVVVGFRVDPDAYNSIGGHYVVRQSHAHTWVEVATPKGWITFDPTSGREDANARAAGAWRSMKNFFDFLEYKWAENVVAYDVKNRENLIRSLDGVMTNTAITTGGTLNGARDWLRELGQSDSFWQKFWSTSLNVLTLVVVLMVAGIVISVVWFAVHQYRLRRRAHRIGIDSLPVHEQLRLARQLAFYDDLTRALQRHRIYKPSYLTPMEFADSLVFLSGAAYETIHRLTRIFYRIRFGKTELNARHQRRLEQVVERLTHDLDNGKTELAAFT